MVRPSGATTVRTGGCFVRVSPRCAGTTYTVRPSGMVTTRGCSLADCAATGPAAESSTPIFTEFASIPIRFPHQSPEYELERQRPQPSDHDKLIGVVPILGATFQGRAMTPLTEIGRASCRERVCQYV